MNIETKTTRRLGYEFEDWFKKQHPEKCKRIPWSKSIAIKFPKEFKNWIEEQGYVETYESSDLWTKVGVVSD